MDEDLEENQEIELLKNSILMQENRIALEEWKDEQYNSPTSMESLGLSWKDFF